MIQRLCNDLLTVTIDSHGAEVQSIVNNRTGEQYLYQGNTKFWGRRSPVLFPIVGSVWDGRYFMDGKEYRLGQHGFARDNEFDVIEGAPDDEAWFCLESSESTLAAYPRRFRLEIGYSLHGERLTVMWRVRNLDDKVMHFQIGAHPAFYYPDFKETDQVHAYLAFNVAPAASQIVGERGGIAADEKAVALDGDGLLPVTESTFDVGTIILADGKVNRVSMLDKDRRPYLSVLFSSPAVGIWTPSLEAPFLCIEPWYGRADRIGYAGEFADREFVNSLAPGCEFDASYMILFENL